MYDSKYFSNVNKYITDGDKVSYTGILVASKLSQKNGQDYPLIDLVDIDFNNAWISSLNAYLNTSYDLIYVLDELNKSNDIGLISKEIDDIWNQINEITSSYITHSSLEQILQENWQRKLTAGDYISIDEETYTISVDGLPTYNYLNTTYTKQSSFNEFVFHIQENYYNKTDTDKVAYDAAYDAILRVIDGADDAFDTLKEISDWILAQNRYTEVSWTEVVNNWKEEFYFTEILDEDGNGTGKYELVSSSDDVTIKEIKNTEYIQLNWKDNYYFYLDESGNYVLLTSPDEIKTDTTYYVCDTKYYIEENYLTDIQNLLNRVNRLDDTVGFKIYNEYLGTYSYSGHCEDIYNLQKEDASIKYNIEILSNNVVEIYDKAEDAYSLAYDAYTLAYSSYKIGYVAYEISKESIKIANSSYDLAYEAIERVGEPTIEEHYSYVEYDEDLFNELKENGYELVYFNDGIWFANEPYNDSYQYAYYVPKQDGTGLTVRVENVEKLSESAYEKSEAALQASYDSLYHLNVDNDNSTYVNLSLQPEDYYGSRDRTLYITTQEASIDSKTGEVYSNGLVNLNCAFNIYSYASSWMMLYVDQDIELE